jgi:hypothetical protein
VADQFSRSSPVARFNTAVALKITVEHGHGHLGKSLHPRPRGGQWLLRGGCLTTAWQRGFLQLVLLSIIIVGQNVQASASDERAENTYQDAEAVLREALQVQEHLLSQDRALERLISELCAPPSQMNSPRRVKAE